MPNFKRARSAISEISHEGWKERRASGPVAPGGWMSKLAAAKKPGPTQHRSSHVQALAPLGCAVFSSSVPGFPRPWVSPSPGFSLDWLHSRNLPVGLRELSPLLDQDDQGDHLIDCV